MHTTDPKRQTLVPLTLAEAAATAVRFERRGPLQRLRRLPGPDQQPMH